MKILFTKKLWTLLCIGFVLAETQAQQKTTMLYTWPVGIQTYTYRNHNDKGPAAILDTIQKLGITEIEGGGAKGVSDADYRKMCDARGIKIASIGVDYGQLSKSLDDVIQKAKTFGATFVMCAWIPHKRAEFNLDNAKKAVEDFDRAGKIFKDNGITFCYHTHGYEFQPYEGGTLMDYLIKNTNPEYVSFEMDVLWVKHGGGDPAKLLEKYGNRWKLLHLKDLKKGVKGDLTGGTPAENDVVLGDGQCDFPTIFKAAHKAGIKHCFIEDESNHEFSQVPRSIAYLKGLKR